MSTPLTATEPGIGEEADRKLQQPGLEAYNDQDTTKEVYSGPTYPSRYPNNGIRQPRNPFGLSALGFGFFVALFTAIIVGGAVGGGLGITLSSCRNQTSLLSQEASPNIGSSGINASTSGTLRPEIASTSSSSSPSSTSGVSNYSAVQASQVNTLALDCPSIDGTGISVTAPPGWRQNYTYHCGLEYRAGSAAASGGTIRDIATIIAYSVEDCIESCFGLNIASFASEFALKCSAVFFSIDLEASVTASTGNCVLKNDTLAAGTSAASNAFGVTATLDAGF